jgi:hypothetical protein
LKIELNERELEIILDALDCWRDKIGSGGNATDEIVDLAADLFESLHRDDGWDRDNDAVPDAAAEFIQAGIDARERAKAVSRAAERRNERMMAGTATPVSNDPIDW